MTLSPIFSHSLLATKPLCKRWFLGSSKTCCKDVTSGSEIKFVMQNITPVCHCISLMISKIGDWNSTELPGRSTWLCSAPCWKSKFEEKMVRVTTWVILKTIEQNPSEYISLLDRKGKKIITIITHRCTCASLHIHAVKFSITWS